MARLLCQMLLLARHVEIRHGVIPGHEHPVADTAMNKAPRVHVPRQPREVLTPHPCTHRPADHVALTVVCGTGIRYTMVGATYGSSKYRPRTHLCVHVPNQRSGLSCTRHPWTTSPTHPPRALRATGRGTSAP